MRGDVLDHVVAGLSFGLPYLVLLLTLASLCFFPSKQFLAWIGIIGTIDASLLLKYGDMDLENIFYGRCCSLPSRLDAYGSRLCSWW